MSEIQFPITVESIKFGDGENYHPKLLFRGKCGDMVSVRPCGDKFDGKTFLGVLIGEVPLSISARWNRESATLTIERSMFNPMIFIPEVNEVVFGCGSWWTRIKSEDQLRKITDHDIANVWYVKALNQLEGAKALGEK